jgi:hypothetical protein
MMWNGSIKNVGRKYDLRYPSNPNSIILKTGTAKNTQTAKAAVVESEPVGGS